MHASIKHLHGIGSFKRKKEGELKRAVHISAVEFADERP